MDAATLLTLWEEEADLPAVPRALALLAAARPGTTVEEWSRRTIGERDGELLALRQELFGDVLDAAATCQACGESLEVSFTADDLRQAAPAELDALRVELDGYQVQSRVPTSLDLLEVTSSSGAEATAGALLRRCVKTARFGDTDIDAAKLPDNVLRAVSEGMAAADPLADVQVALACPACEQTMSITFDVASYLWNEIDELAQRMLVEVHLLAGAYGWTETDVLALSPRRRRLYLEMQGG